VARALPRDSVAVTRPEDTGALAVFLVGDAAATITGASYSIDGWTAQ
jgi:3-hydroxybutyrate dehydrogenase